MTRRQIEVVRRFRAMNTDVEAVVVTDAPRATAAAETLERVERMFHGTEAALSRFLPDSELCALNASAGRRFVASPVLFAAVTAAIDAAAATGGLFDPTILPALVAAGYDRSFELLPDERPGQPFAPVHRSTWSEIALDPATRSILIRPGSALDLGGIGKGFTLDSAAHLLGQYKNFAIDAGGDMIVSGTQPDGSHWGVGVEDPLAPSRDLTCLECTDCAIASSSVARRRWLMGGNPQHHLIDPRTQVPAATGALAATIIAATAVRAETLAKTALILGPGAGIRFLDSQPGVEGLVVLDGGYVQRSAALRERLQVA